MTCQRMICVVLVAGIVVGPTAAMGHAGIKAGAAQREGLTRDERGPDALREVATAAIRQAREAARALLEAGSIAPRPDR